VTLQEAARVKGGATDQSSSQVHVTVLDGKAYFYYPYGD
jgi:hypothetical protein